MAKMPRAQRRRLTKLHVGAWLCFAGIASVFLLRQHFAEQVVEEGHAALSAPMRQLLQADKSKGGADWNPIKTEPGYEGPMGVAGAFIWLAILIWLFAGVAVVTDVYFTPSLEAISNALGLSEDVAGATFLAAASSAPEFFTSMADTFTMGDGGEGYGVGTIVGSAVFNILVIVALSCIPCDRLSLDWYPLIRDSIFYVVSIFLLLITISTGSTTAKNGKTVGLVEWYESLLYVLGYAAYIVYMKYSGDIRPHAVKWKDMIVGTNESGNFPENEKSAEFSCQVVAVAHGGDVELRSDVGGDEPAAQPGAAQGAAHTAPYDDEDAGTMEHTASPQHAGYHSALPRRADSRYSAPVTRHSAPPRAPVAPHQGARARTPRRTPRHAASHHGAVSQTHSAPPAGLHKLPTPRVRKQWHKQQEKWMRRQVRDRDGEVSSVAASAANRPAESAFTQWVIQQRKVRDVQDDALSSSNSPASQNGLNKYSSPANIRQQSLQGLVRAAASARASAEHGRASHTAESAPPNTPSCHQSNEQGEAAARIALLEQEKEAAKQRDDLPEAMRLKKEIERIRAASPAGSLGPVQTGDGGETSGDGGDDDDDEMEEKTVTLLKKEFDDLRAGGALLLEQDDGEGNVGEGDGEANVKVSKTKEAAEDQGFEEDMVIAQINGVDIAVLEDIDEVLKDVSASDTITVLTKQEAEDDFWDWDWPEEDAKVMRALWVTVIPLLAAFKLTIPHAGRRATKRYYWVAFGASIFWIGMLSMFMLKMGSWLGAIAKIDPTVMGIVVMAAGTSVPDAMGSYCAAKMGMADMAVSNALGSNVFNIFAGLGIPWFLSAAIKGKPIQVPKDGIVIPTIILFLVLIFFLTTLFRYNMTLQPRVGKIFMFTMVLYWTWTLLNEFVFKVTL